MNTMRRGSIKDAESDSGKLRKSSARAKCGAPSRCSSYTTVDHTEFGDTCASDAAPHKVRVVRGQSESWVAQETTGSTSQVTNCVCERSLRLQRLTVKHLLFRERGIALAAHFAVTSMVAPEGTTSTST